MSRKYEILTRENMRKLQSGKYLIENCIVYKKINNFDGMFSLSVRVDGLRIRRTVGKDSEGVTIKLVEQVMEKFKTEAREDRLNLPKGRKLHLRLDEASEKYLTNIDLEGGNNIDKKRQHLRDHVRPFFKNVVVTQITTFDIERYKKHRLEQKAAKATINRELATLSHLLNKLIEWGSIPHRQCKINRYNETGRRIEYLTAEEASKLLEAAKNDVCTPFLYPFILIGLETAMRKMEIMSIRLSDMNLEKRTIFIPEAKAGSREQPITDHLANYLEEYIKTIDTNQPWLFPSPYSRSGHLTVNRKAFIRAVDAAGLDSKKIVRHTLRHTAITHLVQAGVDLPTVKRISGHKTLIMVERYAHQSGEHIRAAMDKLENRYAAVSNVVNISQSA